MKLKKSYLKNVTSIVLAFFIVIGWSFSISTNSYAAGETYTIYASKVKTEKADYYTYDKSNNSLNIMELEHNIDFVIDTDIELSRINYTSTGEFMDAYNLTIKGNKKLTVNGSFTMNTSYVQESGTNVVINNGYFKSNGSVTVNSEAKLKIEYHDSDTNNNALYCHRDLNNEGYITVDSSKYGVFAGSNISITGGEMRVNAHLMGIVAIWDIDITGGNVYSNVVKTGIHSTGHISISGGYVESTASGLDKQSSALFSYNVSLADPMYIKVPSNGKIGTYYSSYYDYNENYIVDEEGNTPAHIIIGNKVIEQKSAEEEAAKKAAEEEAAKKAAEEAAAKKATEEASANKAAEGTATNKASEEAANNTVTYNNEWVNGQWYGSNGDTSYTAQGSWKCNSTGWWFEDTAGWYPQSQWVKIDGKWYYFLDSGYMDYSEYRDGYWLGADGAWVEGYQNGTWHVDSTGWWFEDNGWYPSNQYLWINGTKYWFNANGYME